jgi:hypothetical protein
LVYSLGNFIFDINEQHGREKIQNGMLLQLNFFKGRIEPKMIPLKLDNQHGEVTLGNNETLEALMKRWEGQSYWSLWTAECHRIRQEEKHLTQLQQSKGSDGPFSKSRMKWISLFNPTRRTLLIGDLMYKFQQRMNA